MCFYKEEKICIVEYEKSVSEKKAPFWLASHAKINLFLDVLEKMENGYHRISTMFSEISLHDTIKFSLTKYHDIKLLSDIDELKNRDNLIYKVAIFIQNKYSVRYGAKIELKKLIPIAAGLGGGSSNAATTIRGLNWIWCLNLSKGEMHDIAQRFGSDINFFLEGYQALGTGRGEIIQPLNIDLAIENILLVNPNIYILSSEAYELVEFSQPNPNLNDLLDSQDPKYCFNKLEAGILKKYPILSEIFSFLYAKGAKKVILSGSGSTIIGFFGDPRKCESAQDQMKKNGFWTYITLTRRRQNK